MTWKTARDGDSLRLNSTLEDLSAVLINSRKMGIKAVGTLELIVEELAQEEMTTGLGGRRGGGNPHHSPDGCRPDCPEKGHLAGSRTKSFSRPISRISKNLSGRTCPYCSQSFDPARTRFS